MHTFEVISVVTMISSRLYRCFWASGRRCLCSRPSWRLRACRRRCTTSCWRCGRSWWPAWRAAPAWSSRCPRTFLQNQIVSWSVQHRTCILLYEEEIVGQYVGLGRKLLYVFVASFKAMYMCCTYNSSKSYISNKEEPIGLIDNDFETQFGNVTIFTFLWCWFFWNTCSSQYNRVLKKHAMMLVNFHELGAET